MKCRCISEIGYQSDYKIGDIYEDDNFGDGGNIIVSQDNGKLHWVITKCQFYRWFVDIVEDRDRKISEVLGG